MVKFDRQAIHESYDVGTHDIVVTGVVAGVTFQASAEIELFEPGDARPTANNG